MIEADNMKKSPRYLPNVRSMKSEKIQNDFFGKHHCGGGFHRPAGGL